MYTVWAEYGVFHAKACGTYSNRFALEGSNKENVFIIYGLFKDAVTNACYKKLNRRTSSE